MSKDAYDLKLETIHLTVPYLKEKRRIRVLLPKDYQKNGDQFYPVVYFHDGQNVFHSRESYSGHSWKTISTVKNYPKLPQMIIVGIDNDNEGRIDEYTPWPITNAPFHDHTSLGGMGDQYADFVMTVVKSFIDTTFRTKTDRKHTAVIGSSLGEASLAIWV